LFRAMKKVFNKASDANRILNKSFYRI